MSQFKGKIILKNVMFFAYHGIYDFERTTGGEYEVDVEIEKTFYETESIDLSNTVDYSQLYTIVEREMAIPQGLLETLSQNILRAIEMHFMNLAAVRIEVRKLNPPIPGAKMRHSAFQLEKTFQYPSL